MATNKAKAELEAEVADLQDENQGCGTSSRPILISLRRQMRTRTKRRRRRRTTPRTDHSRQCGREWRKAIRLPMGSAVVTGRTPAR
jgi:hypothetical protein